jgi:formylglycine-generating enzyme required for sulfatase activity
VSAAGQRSTTTPGAARRRGLRRGRLSVLAVAGLASLATACRVREVPPGGIKVFLIEDGALPANALHVVVSSGDRRTVYRSAVYPLPQYALPQTLAIVSNGDPTASVVLDVGLTIDSDAGESVPLDAREYAFASLPTNRFAEFTVAFDARCSAAACGNGQTCDGAGGCTSSAVDSAMLPTLPADGGAPIPPVPSVEVSGGGDAASGDGGPGSADAQSGVCQEGAKQCRGYTPQTCMSGVWQSGPGCGAGHTHCVDGVCETVPPSCANAPPGTGFDCASGDIADCCGTYDVPGGAFLRDYDGVSFPIATHPAALSAFRLDAFEVTVGRFRQFVQGTPGQHPATGDGRHVHLNGELGLVGAGVGDAGVLYESGWQDAWNAELPTTPAEWDARLLSCNVLGDVSTWTSEPGPNENLPIGCVDWYEAYWFCIWDGGFLPSDAEWNFAASGGAQQRQFPWGALVPQVDSTLAIFACIYGPNNATCPSVANIAPVGTSRGGDGLFGQSDLAGNVWEWNLDLEPDAGLDTAVCHDCAQVTGGVRRNLRGGDYESDPQDLYSSVVEHADPGARGGRLGVRCARPYP